MLAVVGCGTAARGHIDPTTAPQPGHGDPPPMDLTATPQPNWTAWDSDGWRLHVPATWTAEASSPELRTISSDDPDPLVIGLFVRPYKGQFDLLFPLTRHSIRRCRVSGRDCRLARRVDANGDAERGTVVLGFVADGNLVVAHCSGPAKAVFTTCLAVLGTIEGIGP